MIGVVVVSHSARLAEGVCELAAQVGQEKVRLAAAGGTADPEHPIGTDAFRVLRAIESVYSEDGVVVLMDLGSAVLSAETALDLLAEDRRGRVRLCHAPLVEAAVAAASLAAAGAGLEEIVREAVAAVPARSALSETARPAAEIRVTVPNRLGLHARPAAQLVRLARRFPSRLTVENLDTQAGPVDAGSINGVLSLAARQGQRLLIRAQGPEAKEAAAAVADFIATVEEEADAPAAAPARAGELAGIPASAGIAIGPLLKLRPAPLAAEARTASDPETEWQRLLDALRSAQQETRELYDWALTHAGRNEAGIFDAQSLFLEDPALLEAASRRIRQEHLSAERAFEAACRDVAALADVADVAARVLRKPGAPVALEQPALVAAHDLAPSEVRALDPARVLGLCLEAGSAGEHSVILARAMGIPVVVGLGAGLAAVADGTTIALDGAQGQVWVSPDPERIRALEDSRRHWLRARRAAQAARHSAAATRDGRRIRVLANINSVAGAIEALENGAEGVGVLRTEFLFLGRQREPDEEEQLAAYRAIAETLGARPLVVRTLDIGGDKSLPYVEIPAQANPFLGWRGIRVSLGRRDLLKTQLRAILRAGETVEVLFPMIATVAELRAAKAVLREAADEVHRAGVRAGVMIEVPAAVAVADQLAREADFFSIGTNDLAQYVMAADRTNARVAAIAVAFQPAVLRMVAQTIQAARSAGIGVALCGELAADPLATPLLLGLGLEELSVSAPLIPELKRAIAQSTLGGAEEIAREALAQDSAESVRSLLARAR